MYLLNHASTETLTNEWADDTCWRKTPTNQNQSEIILKIVQNLQVLLFRFFALLIFFFNYVACLANKCSHEDLSFLFFVNSEVLWYSIPLHS